MKLKVFWKLDLLIRIDYMPEVTLKKITTTKRLSSSKISNLIGPNHDAVCKGKVHTKFTRTRSAIGISGPLCECVNRGLKLNRFTSKCLYYRATAVIQTFSIRLLRVLT